MHLAADYIHPTPRGGRCRVRVYLPEDERDAPAWYAATRARVEARAALEQAEELRRALEVLGERASEER